MLSSGQAATATALLGLLQSGDEVICSSAIYGGTLHLLGDLLPRLGIRDAVRLRSRRWPIDRRCDPSGRRSWCGSSRRSTRRCAASTSRRLRRRAAPAACSSVIDNTFASPVNQAPIALGVDIVMHSATKYLNGHSDVTAGALAGPSRLLAPIEKARRLVGGILDPYAAYRASAAALKTLDVRVAAPQRQRHGCRRVAASRTAASIASTIPGSSRIRITRWPRVRCRALAGWCVSISAGGLERASRFFDRLGLIKRAASLGGIESLCSLPVLTSQWGHTPEQLERAGVTPGMARLSIGLEDAGRPDRRSRSGAGLIQAGGAYLSAGSFFLSPGVSCRNWLGHLRDARGQVAARRGRRTSAGSARPARPPWPSRDGRRRCRCRRTSASRTRRHCASSRGCARSTMNEPPTMPAMIVHLTSSSCRKKSAV